MEVIVEQKTAQKAGEILSEKLLRARSYPILLMLSGGSSLRVLEHVSADSLREHVTITVLDERYDVSNEEYNFSKLLASNFYTIALEQGAALIDPRPEERESLRDAGRRFAEHINRWCGFCPNGVVITTQGVGEDGHTAGIMPFPNDPQQFIELFGQGTAVGYELASDATQFSKRITVTLSFLRKAVSASVVHVAGEKKRATLSRVLAEEGTLHETPGRIIREMRDTIVITDIEISNDEGV